MIEAGPLPAQRVTVHLRGVSGPLWRRLKREAATRNLTLPILTDQAIMLWLAMNEGLADDALTDDEEDAS